MENNKPKAVRRREYHTGNVGFWPEKYSEEHPKKPNVNGVWIKRHGIFFDPEAYLIKLPGNEDCASITYGARIISLNQIEGLANKTHDPSSSREANKIAREARLRRIEKRISGGMGKIISGATISEVLPPRESNGQYLVGLGLDESTTIELNYQRSGFFMSVKARKMLAQGDISFTFASFGFNHGHDAHEWFNQLGESGVVGQKVELGPATSDYPIAEL